MKPMVSPYWLLAFSVVVLGCGGDIPQVDRGTGDPPPPDASILTDGGSDAGPDVGHDARTPFASLPILGAANIGGLIHLSPADPPEPLKAARYLEGIGSRIVKFALTYDAQWGAPILGDMTDLVTRAKHPTMQALFAEPLRVYVMWAYRPGNTSVARDVDVVAEQSSMRDLCEHLMDTYQGTGKVFVITHWEGDNALGLSTAHPEIQPAPSDIAGMVSWLNARHQGIADCRLSRALLRDVAVYDAVEVNDVQSVMRDPTRDRIVNRILPNVDCDLVSYSAWDSLPITTGAPLQQNLSGIDSALGAAIDFISTHATGRSFRTSVYQTPIIVPATGSSIRMECPGQPISRYKSKRPQSLLYGVSTSDCLIARPTRQGLQTQFGYSTISPSTRPSPNISETHRRQRRHDRTIRFSIGSTAQCSGAPLPRRNLRPRSLCSLRAQHAACCVRIF